MDRYFDNYISTPQQKVVFDSLRPEADRYARGVADARAMLDTASAWLDQHMAGPAWAAGDDFSLADCGAAHPLFYAYWTPRLALASGNVVASPTRPLHRPSFPRAVST